MTKTRGENYKCSRCELAGHKLWRQYQTVASVCRLLCASCAEADQKKRLDPLRDGDQIGWLVPAVPVIGEDTFWGYTSVPNEGCLWWDALPTFTNTEREIEWLRARCARLASRVVHFQNRELERLGIEVR